MRLFTKFMPVAISDNLCHILSDIIDNLKLVNRRVDFVSAR